ncbi:hypothetical protein GCM10010319_61580 [Streptomyces blastmyceticus]|uniref:Uncharacterized protein n=1 Tax=Streptomyces blastmyceticus TaxID=68180 RepID=A0ABN0XWC9_9ACTN
MTRVVKRSSPALPRSVPARPITSKQDRDPARLALLVASAAEQLGRGGDLSHGFYLGQPIFLSLALVTCSPNRAESELSCPLG